MMHFLCQCTYSSHSTLCAGSSKAELQAHADRLNRSSLEANLRLAPAAKGMSLEVPGSYFPYFLVLDVMDWPEIGETRVCQSCPAAGRCSLLPPA